MLLPGSTAPPSHRDEPSLAEHEAALLTDRGLPPLPEGVTTTPVRVLHGVF